MQMERVSVALPPSVMRIIEDRSRKRGEKVAAHMRKNIIEHMIANDEMFVCNKCHQYIPYEGMGVEQDVCAMCESGN